MKKNFLWILPYFPYPPVTGGNVRIFNLIRRLSRFFDIHLLSFYDSEPESGDVKELEKYCRRVSLVKRELFEGPLPMIFQCYDSPAMWKELEKVLRDRFDFVQIDFLTMAYYARELKKSLSCPLFFTEHDVSSFYFERCFHNRHLAEKERYVEWLRMRKVMEELYPLFNAIFTVSYHDAELLKERYPSLGVYPAPTGTDTVFYEFRPRRSSCDLVYVGHYVHYPNVESVEYIADKIFPPLRKRFKDMKFYIVGSAGEKVFPEKRKFSCEGIVVTGTVPDKGLMYLLI